MKHMIECTNGKDSQTAAAVDLAGTGYGGPSIARGNGDSIPVPHIACSLGVRKSSYERFSPALGKASLSVGGVLVLSGVELHEPPRSAAKCWCMLKRSK